MQEEQIKQQIMAASQLSLESRHVAERLQRLLPQRLQGLQRGVRRAAQSQGNKISVAKAARLALLDARYEAHLNELLELREQALAARLEWEDAQRRWQMQKSLRRYHL